MSRHVSRSLALMRFGPVDTGRVNDNSRARGVLPGTGPERQNTHNQLTGKLEKLLTYGACLRGYVADIRAAGATPMICSPVAQKRWKTGATLNAQLVVMGLMEQGVLPDGFYTQRFESR